MIWEVYHSLSRLGRRQSRSGKFWSILSPCLLYHGIICRTWLHQLSSASAACSIILNSILFPVELWWWSGNWCVACNSAQACRHESFLGLANWNPCLGWEKFQGCSSLADINDWCKRCRASISPDTFAGKGDCSSRSVTTSGCISCQLYSFSQSKVASQVVFILNLSNIIFWTVPHNAQANSENFGEDFLYSIINTVLEVRGGGIVCRGQ